MIEPIKDILTNWRNPQYRKIKDVQYDLGIVGPVTIYHVGEEALKYTNNYRGTVSTRYTAPGAAPAESSTSILPLNTVVNIYVPRDSHTTYLAYQFPAGPRIVLRDLR